VGSHVCTVLQKAGTSFKGLVRSRSQRDLLEMVPEQNIITGDLLDPLGMEALLTEVDTVIHCAGLVSFQRKDKEALYASNVESTRVLVNACLAAGVNKFIHVSSIAALGRNKKNTLMEENTKWENSKLNTEYAKSKYLGELEVWRASVEGLSVNIINPSIILAPHSWERSSTAIFNYVKRKFPFYPSGNINYVDLRDVTEVIIHLTQMDIRNERFVLNGGNLSYKQFFEEVARRFNIKAPTIRLNQGLAWMGWSLSHVKGLLTGKPSLVTSETTRLSFTK